MRNFLFAALFVVSGAVAEAAVLSAAGPEGGPYLIQIETVEGESFRGFDATLTGAVRQSNPFGSLATIFNDNNGLFANDPNADLSEDSQFLFASGDVLSIGAEEGDGTLKAAVQGLSSLGLSNPVDFIQVATEDPEMVNVDLSIDIGLPEALVFSGTLQQLLVPEPTSALLAGLAAVGFVARRR